MIFFKFLVFLLYDCVGWLAAGRGLLTSLRLTKYIQFNSAKTRWAQSHAYLSHQRQTETLA